MIGLDEVELQVEIEPHVPAAQVVKNSHIVKQGLGTVVSVLPPQLPVSDYDDNWAGLAHPTAFPHNRGYCPEGTSFIAWARIIMQRYPLQQFQHNAGLATDLFNIWQRHEVYLHSYIQLKLTPFMARDIANLTEIEVRTTHPCV